MSDSLGKILIIDNDTHIRDLLSSNLGSEGFEVDQADVAADVDVPSTARYRLVIVDCMNQPYTGLQLCQAIKENKPTANLPVIICSTTDSESIIIDAFDIGAEDYVIKPFSLREFTARIKAILRRHPVKVVSHAEEQPTFDFPEVGLTIEVGNNKVTVNQSVVALTKTEYTILLFLVENRNSFFTRADICSSVWKDEETNNERIVDTNISRLRKKLGDSGKFIINRYGMGYAFVDKVQHT